MAVSDKPWSTFSESDYPTAEDYCRASLVDLNPSGQRKTKDQCHLPVREPKGGPLNRNGVHAAAGRLNQTSIPPAERARAARQLLRLYREIGDQPPASLVRMGRG